MNILAEIGEAFGQNGATVSVSLESSEYYGNDTLRGIVAVTGGAHDQPLRELVVRVIEHVDGGRSYSQWTPHATVVVAEALTVASGSRHEFPFQFRLPQTAEPTHEAPLLGYDWYVEAEAHFAHVLTAHSSRAAFALLPPPIPPALAALPTVLQQVAPFALRRQSRDGAKVRYEFLPPPSAAERLDAVELLLEEADGFVQGVLRINRKEHTLTDHLKTIVHADITDYPLKFPVSALTDSPGSPAFGEIAATLEKLLRPFLGPTL